MFRPTGRQAVEGPRSQARANTSLTNATHEYYARSIRIDNNLFRRTIYREAGGWCRANRVTTTASAGLLKLAPTPDYPPRGLTTETGGMHTGRGARAYRPAVGQPLLAGVAVEPGGRLARQVHVVQATRLAVQRLLFLGRDNAGVAPIRTAELEDPGQQRSPPVAIGRCGGPGSGRDVLRPASFVIRAGSHFDPATRASWHSPAPSAPQRADTKAPVDPYGRAGPGSKPRSSARGRSRVRGRGATLHRRRCRPVPGRVADVQKERSGDDEACTEQRPQEPEQPPAEIQPENHTHREFSPDASRTPGALQFARQ